MRMNRRINLRDLKLGNIEEDMKLRLRRVKGLRL
jgi:hypothetical protein